jgi:hypothetical protein
MAEKSRGLLLTTFAVLFAILGTLELLQALPSSERRIRILRSETHGKNAILGPVFRLMLMIYAIGIWRMRR